jgi:hypothetical protein
MFKIIIGILALFGILIWRSERKRRKIQTDAEKRLDDEQVARQALKTELSATLLRAKNAKLSLKTTKKGE